MASENIKYFWLEWNCLDIIQKALYFKYGAFYFKFNKELIWI